jgi:hypothetical protein
LGDPWTVSADLPDDAPLPTAPDGAVLAPPVRPAIVDVIRALPPTNADLRRLWAESGLIADPTTDDGSIG